MVRPSIDLTVAKGVYVIAPTAFAEDGSIDERSNDRFIAFCEESEAAGLTVLGQAGEASKLTHGEAVAVARRAARRSKLPVIAGVSGMGLAAMRELALEAMSAGAVGVMVAPASGLRTDEQILGYFSQVADTLGPDIPFVLQDYPLVFNVVISADVIRKLAAAVPSFQMLKQEDWPGLEKISALRAFERDKQMPRISILCGSGGIFLDLEVARGADGAMTGYCFVDALIEFVGMMQDGRREEAQDLFDRHLPLIRYEHQPGIGLAARKYVLMRRGLLDSDAQRKPRPMLSSAARGELDYLLSRVAHSDKPRFGSHPLAAPAVSR